MNFRVLLLLMFLLFSSVLGQDDYDTHHVRDKLEKQPIAAHQTKLEAQPAQNVPIQSEVQPIEAEPKLKAEESEEHAEKAEKSEQHPVKVGLEQEAHPKAESKVELSPKLQVENKVEVKPSLKAEAEAEHHEQKEHKELKEAKSEVKDSADEVSEEAEHGAKRKLDIKKLKLERETEVSLRTGSPRQTQTVSIGLAPNIRRSSNLNISPASPSETRLVRSQLLGSEPMPSTERVNPSNVNVRVNVLNLSPAQRPVSPVLLRMREQIQQQQPPLQQEQVQQQQPPLQQEQVQQQPLQQEQIQQQPIQAEQLPQQMPQQQGQNVEQTLPVQTQAPLGHQQMLQTQPEQIQQQPIQAQMPVEAEHKFKPVEQVEQLQQQPIQSEQQFAQEPVQQQPIQEQPPLVQPTRQPDLTEVQPQVQPQIQPIQAEPLSEQMEFRNPLQMSPTQAELIYTGRYPTLIRAQVPQIRNSFDRIQAQPIVQTEQVSRNQLQTQYGLPLQQTMEQQQQLPIRSSRHMSHGVNVVATSN